MTPCYQHDSYQPHCADCRDMARREQRLIGQKPPFRILRQGAPQKVPSLTAMPTSGQPPLGPRFMGLASAVYETSEGPALAITVQGPGGIAVTALILQDNLTPALEALNSSASRMAAALIPEPDQVQG